MGSTAISYATKAVNGLIGCPGPLCSRGCKRCWSRDLHDKRHRAFKAGKKLAPQYAKPFSRLQIFPERFEEPFRWKKPQTVFVASGSDLFHEAVPDWVPFRVWQVAQQTRYRHLYLVLTKRPERMLAWARRLADAGPVDVEPAMVRNGKHTSWVTDEGAAKVIGSGRGAMFAAWVKSLGKPPPGAAAPTYDWAEGPRWWPTVAPNVLLGASICTQAEAVRILPVLRELGALGWRVWVSFEPLLEFIGAHLDGIEWAVVGGESGPRALVRPCELDAIRGVKALCAYDGVRCYVKQMGSHPLAGARDPLGIAFRGAGDDPKAWPKDLRLRELPLQTSWTRP